MKLDEIKGATVRPKDTVKVKTDNAVNFIFTKDDSHEMIIAMDVIYNLMDDRRISTLKMEGSKETGTFWDVSSTCIKSGSTTPFY
jgi:hypothetical protein